MANDEVDFSFKALTRRPFVFGLAIARNTGERPAVIDSIALADPSPGLRTIQTHLAGADRTLLGSASDDEWPSDNYDDVRPVAGHVLAPDSTEEGRRGIELIIVMRAPKPGRYTATGVVVNYRVGDDTHRVTLRNTMAVCVSRKLDLKSRCKLPEVPLDIDD